MEETSFQTVEGLALVGHAAASLGLWRWDLCRDEIQICERLTAILGAAGCDSPITPADVRGLIYPEDRERVEAAVREAVRARSACTWEARIIRPDGSVRRVLSQGSYAETAGTREMFGVLRDITDGDRRSRASEVIAQRLSRVIAEFPALIAIKSPDHRYVMVNAAMAQFAGRPAEELIGLGADEVFPDVAREVDAHAAAAMASDKAVHTDVTTLVDGETRTFHLVSFALRDEHEVPVEVCCIASDVTVQRRHQADARLRRETSELIGSALTECRIHAARQPVVDIAAAQVVSQELLVRLALPDNGGVLQPAGFLPMAERFGLIQPIDIWMLSRALALAEEGCVQVNLSGVTLSDPDARSTIISALTIAPAAAERIVFEITETAAAHNLDAAVDFAHRVTELGCGLALDDFGVGFGSFTYLRRLPLRYLKIDRSFVTHVAASAGDRRVVASIISIARQFDLRTIAEGVEDARTLEVLAELGADYAQGFYLGRPDLD